MIRERMKAAQNRQKSYADNRQRNLEFAVGDWVYLKVLPMKRVICFGKKGKLSPRYVGPFEVIKRVGLVAYGLDLPAEVKGIHNVFHVSTLKKSFGERWPVVMELDEIWLQPNLSYKEWPMQIVDSNEQELRNRKIPLVKILEEGFIFDKHYHVRSNNRGVARRKQKEEIYAILMRGRIESHNGRTRE
ncbi:uncharacterized protein LOC121242235 [Juglans microcarpa x Juglans regia]|uniref:uncharacterized protein LOC121242235 n=1 Tax=Juglans microcarpa x Juglans regia TaxID=2249226 RepID=UPI001B7ED6B2|nr:uncharacterized protein LOC121242235 [Juglans microcarpa x Juglans regia]